VIHIVSIGFAPVSHGANDRRRQEIPRTSWGGAISEDNGRRTAVGCCIHSAWAWHGATVGWLLVILYEIMTIMIMKLI
jgi:hypothetical protein